MPTSYNEEAVEHCFRLYLRFNGQQHDRIEQEMRRAGWATWSKQNLYSRGEKVGWVEKFGWKSALEQKIATSSKTAALTSAQELVGEIEEVRKRVKAALDARGANVDKDLIYQHARYCALSIEAQLKLEATRDTLGGFVTFWERLLDWLPEISERAARELLKAADAILERAAAEYGEKKDGA
jgi:hypothetical protein